MRRIHTYNLYYLCVCHGNFVYNYQLKLPFELLCQGNSLHFCITSGSFCSKHSWQESGRCRCCCCGCGCVKSETRLLDTKVWCHLYPQKPLIKRPQPSFQVVSPVAVIWRSWGKQLAFPPGWLKALHISRYRYEMSWHDWRETPSEMSKAEVDASMNRIKSWQHHSSLIRGMESLKLPCFVHRHWTEKVQATNGWRACVEFAEHVWAKARWSSMQWCFQTNIMLRVFLENVKGLKWPWERNYIIWKVDIVSASIQRGPEKKTRISWPKFVFMMSTFVCDICYTKLQFENDFHETECKAFVYFFHVARSLFVMTSSSLYCTNVGILSP